MKFNPLLLIAILLCSCGDSLNKNYSGKIELSNTKVHECSKQPNIFMQSDSAIYFDAYICDSLLITLTNPKISNYGMITVYRLNDKKELITLGKKGRGHNEYTMFKMNPPYKDSLDGHWKINTFNDVRQLIQIDITKSIEENSMIVSRKESYGDKYTRLMDYATTVNFLPDGKKLIIYPAHQKDVRDKEFTPIRVFLEDVLGISKEIKLFPEPIYGKENALNVDFYRYKFGIKPDGTKLIIAMQLFDLVSIVDIKSGKVKGIKESGSLGIEEIKNYTREMMYPKPILAHAIATTDNYFFIYNINERFDRYGASFGEKTDSYIVMYNWDGEALAKINVKEGYLSSLFFDESTSRLYTGLPVEGVIAYYDLKDVIEKAGNRI